MFSHNTQHWRGRPLTDRAAVVEPIGATTTETGLRIECLFDERSHVKGFKVSDAEMAELDITGAGMELHDQAETQAECVAVIIAQILRVGSCMNFRREGGSRASAFEPFSQTFGKMTSNSESGMHHRGEVLVRESPAVECAVAGLIPRKFT